MNDKQIVAEKSAHTKPGGTQSTSELSTRADSSSHNYLLWISAAVLLAGITYLFMSRGTSSNTQPKASSLPSILPESYGLCTEPGKIYTVDEGTPTVDCIIVRKDEILTTGTKGTSLLYVINFFY